MAKEVADVVDAVEDHRGPLQRQPPRDARHVLRQRRGSPQPVPHKGNPPAAHKGAAHKGSAHKGLARQTPVGLTPRRTRAPSRRGARPSCARQGHAGKQHRTDPTRRALGAGGGTSGKPMGRSISGRNMPELPISTHLLSPARTIALKTRATADTRAPPRPRLRARVLCGVRSRQPRWPSIC